MADLHENLVARVAVSEIGLVVDRIACAVVLDSPVERGRAPVWPGARLVLRLLGDQCVDDLPRRGAGAPGAVQGEDDDIDPFSQVARAGLDLLELLADVVDHAGGSRSRAEGALAEFLLALQVGGEVERIQAATGAAHLVGLVLELDQAVIGSVEEGVHVGGVQLLDGVLIFRVVLRGHDCSLRRSAQSQVVG